VRKALAAARLAVRVIAAVSVSQDRQSARWEATAVMAMVTEAMGAMMGVTANNRFMTMHCCRLINI